LLINRLLFAIISELDRLEVFASIIGEEGEAVNEDDFGVFSLFVDNTVDF